MTRIFLRKIIQKLPLIMLYVQKVNIYYGYISKHNSILEKKITLLMALNEET